VVEGSFTFTLRAFVENTAECKERLIRCRRLIALARNEYPPQVRERLGQADNIYTSREPSRFWSGSDLHESSLSFPLNQGTMTNSSDENSRSSFSLLYV
jgi:hypothetical protein